MADDVAIGIENLPWGVGIVGRLGHSRACAPAPTRKYGAWGARRLHRAGGIEYACRRVYLIDWQVWGVAGTNIHNARPGIKRGPYVRMALGALYGGRHT